MSTNPVKKKTKIKSKINPDAISLETRVTEKSHTTGNRPRTSIFAEASGTGKQHKIILGGGLNIPISKKVSITPSIGFISEKSKLHTVKGSSAKLGINIKI